MRKMLLSIALILSSFAVSYAQELVSTDPAPRNVVLEEFTGIYCGYCPQGHIIGNKLAADNPGRVVLINVHAGGYANPQKQSDPDFRTPFGDNIDNLSNVGGYPAGTVNRTLFAPGAYQQQNTNALALSRGGWTGAAQEIFNSANSPVNIGAKIQRTANNKLFITVELFYTADGQGENKLNVVLLESGVLGYQSGGNMGNNYVHNHILRDMVTGQWGTSISNTSKGTFVKKTFNYDITDRVFDLSNDLDIAIFVTKADNKSTFTGIDLEVPTEIVPLNSSLTSADGENMSSRNQGEGFEKTFTIENNTNSAIEYSIEALKTGRTPSDWTASITPDANFSVEAGMSQEIKLTLTPGMTPGLGDASIEITEQNTDEKYSYGSKQISCISKEIKAFSVMAPAHQDHSVNEFILNAGYDDFFNIKQDEFLNFASIISPETVVWNNGEAGQLNDDDNAALNTLMGNGTNVLLMGTLVLPTLNTNNKFNISYKGTSRYGFGQAPFTVWLKGISGDPITQDFGSSIEGNLISYLVPIIKINDESTTTPILTFRDNGNYRTAGSQTDIPINANDAIIGVKYEKDEQKAVFLSFNPHVILNQNTKNDLIANALNFIAPQASDDATVKSSVKSIDFGETLLNNPSIETISFTNTGAPDLTIDNVILNGNDDGVFELTYDGKPVTLAFNETVSFTVKFLPTTVGDFFANVTIASNATNNDEISVELQGLGSEGDAILSIEDESVEFGDIEIGKAKAKMIEFMNIGPKELTVTDIDLTGSGSSVFEIVSTAGDFPIKVPTNEKLELEVIFTPTEEKSYFAFLGLISDAVNNDDISFSIDGSGKPSSVYVENSDLIDVNIGPNPIKENGTINYEINSITPQFVKMTLFNSTGENLGNIVNGTFTSGNYSKELNTELHPSGSYYVVVEIDGVLLMKSFVISK